MISPFFDLVVIQPDEAEKVTKGGIHLPDVAKEKPQWGKIVAVGPGRMDEGGDFICVCAKVGDVVLYPKYAGTEIEHEGVKLRIVRESELLGKIHR